MPRGMNPKSGSGSRGRAPARPSITSLAVPSPPTATTSGAAGPDRLPGEPDAVAGRAREGALEVAHAARIARAIRSNLAAGPPRRAAG